MFFRAPATGRDIVSRHRPLNVSLVNEIRFPVNNLQAAILLLFANDFLRKSLKQLYINESLMNKYFGQRVVPRLVKQLGKLLFNLTRNYSSSKLLGGFYTRVVRKQPQLGSYRATSFLTYFEKLLAVLQNCTQTLRPSDDFGISAADEDFDILYSNKPVLAPTQA